MISFPGGKTFIMIKLGNITFDIRWYAVLIVTGAILAYFVCKSDAKKAKYIDDDFFDSLFIYSLWFGIIGARLWFCAFYNFSYYLNNPSQIIRIWDGGLAIQGGVVFGLIFAYLYCKKNHYSFLKITDIILPNVLIGQAIGRWGNFVNKECHGKEVGIEYFDGILSFLRNGMNINNHYYEPLFFYESVLCIVGWLIIRYVLKKNQSRRGELSYEYLMWYGIVRLFIESTRTDSLYIGNIKMAQLTSIIFIGLGMLGYLGIFDKLIKNKEKPSIIFDMDGTVIDTHESIWAGFEAVFKKYSDVSLFTDAVKEEVLGPALRDEFKKYFPDKEYDELYKVYREKQIEVSPKLNKLTVNIDNALKNLHEQGYKIAIVSTRRHSGIEELLKDFNLSEYVDAICGLDDVKNTKPDPEGIIKVINENKWNKDCIMIGDSLMDVESGINYGAYTIAYLCNPNRSEELVKAANASISDMNEILDIVKQNINFTYNEQ